MPTRNIDQIFDLTKNALIAHGAAQWQADDVAKATADVEKSKCIAMPPCPSGTEQAIGFVPITRDLPPGAATTGDAFVNPSPIKPWAAICSVK